VQLEQLTQDIGEFVNWGHTDKIKLFAWHLHVHKSIENFQPKQIKDCFTELHLDEPSNIRQLLVQLGRKKPPEVLYTRAGFRLELRQRNAFDQRFGRRKVTVQLTRALEELPSKVTTLSEQVFVHEAVICLKNEAFRAAIIMAWNVAYYHLCSYILKDDSLLATFNSAWPKTFSSHYVKKGRPTVNKYEDFPEYFKESEVLTIARNGKILTGELYKIMERNLGIRNSASHPNSTVIEQPQAEAVIHDLITNVILKLT
jgi:hypothetical protein